MMKNFHGLFSLLLVFISILIGLNSVFTSSTYMGIIYILVLILSIIMLLFSFCAKCVCREDGCGHIIPGKLTKYLPKRESGKYSISDYGGLIISLFLIFGFPQPFLLNNKLTLFFFWLLIIAALAEIFLYVCKDCKNNYCPKCPNKKDVIS